MSLKTGMISILTMLFSSAIIAAFYYWYCVVKKKVPFIRSIPAIEAIPEGVDRAVEMGKPVHYTPGGRAELVGLYAPMTLSSMSILKVTARLCAEKGARLIVSAPQNPETLPLVQALVEEQYIVAGHPEAYKREDIRWHSSDQVPYQAGVIGIFAREGVATNIMMGACAGDSVAIMTSAHEHGAMNIGGTPRWIMTYIFAMVSDYVVIGDELYAAGAKISEDPLSLSNIAAADIIKWGMLGLILLFTVLGLAGVPVLGLFKL